MAAPLFTQAEVNRLLAMPKHVRFEDWEGKWSLRHGDEQNKKRIVAYPDDGSQIEFRIERAERVEREEISITLSVKFPNRDAHSLCRYDVQWQDHKNPKWFSPRYVPPRKPHKHVYNARAVKDGTPSDWDRCASPVEMGGTGTPQQLIDRLLRTFAKYMKIDFHDAEAQATMFGGHP